jgi:hypothetical protein
MSCLARAGRLLRDLVSPAPPLEERLDAPLTEPDSGTLTRCPEELEELLARVRAAVSRRDLHVGPNGFLGDEGALPRPRSSGAPTREGRPPRARAGVGGESMLGLLFGDEAVTSAHSSSRRWEASSFEPACSGAEERGDMRYGRRRSPRRRGLSPVVAGAGIGYVAGGGRSYGDAIGSVSPEPRFRSGSPPRATRPIRRASARGWSRGGLTCAMKAPATLCLGAETAQRRGLSCVSQQPCARSLPARSR